MTMRKKLVIAGLVLLSAVGYLAVAGSKGGLVTFMPVDQFATSTEVRQQRVRLTGKVSPDGLDVNAGAMVAKFALAGEKHRLPVSYRGVVPDMFKADHEVVVEGKLDAAGVFQADLLMTKCASKYEKKPAGHVKTAGQ